MKTIRLIQNIAIVAGITLSLIVADNTESGTTEIMMAALMVINIILAIVQREQAGHAHE